MSRSKGTFNFAANFEPLVKAPLDARMIVQNYSDLIDPSTWKDLDENVWLYTGAIVSVANDPSKGLYFLTDEANYTDYSYWESVGSQNEIDASLNIVNVGIGDASVFYRENGTNFELRTILGQGGITVSTSDNLIVIDSSVGGSSGTYDTTLDPSLAMPSAVGGIPEGTLVNELKGDTLISMWDSLLFPTIDPTYVLPNNAFSDDATNLQEVGIALSIDYSATFSRGAINVNGVFQDYRSGLPHSYNYTDPSSNTLLVDASSTSLSNDQLIDGYVVTIGSQSWTNSVQYSEGPQPLDSKGNPIDSPLAPGTTTAKTVSIEGVYPIFATTASIIVLTKQDLQSMSISTSPSYTLVAETEGNKQKFQLPDKWTGSPTNNPLTGIQTYNTVSSSWVYQGGSAATSLTYWTTSSTTQNIQGITENYTEYTYNSDDRSSIQIRLIF